MGIAGFTYIALCLVFTPSLYWLEPIDALIGLGRFFLQCLAWPCCLNIMCRLWYVTRKWPLAGCKGMCVNIVVALAGCIMHKAVNWSIVSLTTLVDGHWAAFIGLYSFYGCVTFALHDEVREICWHIV